MSSFELLKYTEEQRCDILKLFGRTQKGILQDVENIREWFRKQEHLPEIPDAKFIENCLMLNKFNFEKTKEKLDMYYTVHTLVPEFYDKKIDKFFVESINKIMYLTPLPNLTNENCRIIVFKFKDTNSDNFNAVDAFTHFFNSVDIRLREDCFASVIYIVDCEGLGTGHLIKMNPSLLRKIAFISQRVLPNGIKTIHLVNFPSLAESFIGLVKSFLKPKLADRIALHSDVKTLFKTIPKDLLPSDYGGSEQSLEVLNERWTRAMLDYSEKLNHVRSLKVNEDLRREQKYNVDMLGGVAGNFRKLSLD